MVSYLSSGCKEPGLGHGHILVCRAAGWIWTALWSGPPGFQPRAVAGLLGAKGMRGLRKEAPGHSLGSPVTSSSSVLPPLRTFSPVKVAGGYPATFRVHISVLVNTCCITTLCLRFLIYKMREIFRSVSRGCSED